jgi:hypothetical protein
MVIEKFPDIFKKIVKSSVALVKRNQISTWAMWKSDFHMAHGEIIFILLLFDEFFKKLVKLQHKIAWLTHTGIQFPNGP